MSHMLSKVTLDSSFQEEREQIVEGAQSGGGYLMAGLMGFTGGVFSGITSMVTQPYKGAQESGIGVREFRLYLQCTVVDVSHYNHPSPSGKTYKEKIMSYERREREPVSKSAYNTI